MERVKEAASSEGPHGRDQHIHIGILYKGLVASICNHTSESVVLCLASTYAWLGSKFFGTFTRIVVKVYNLFRV